MNFTILIFIRVAEKNNEKQIQKTCYACPITESSLFCHYIINSKNS